MISAENIKSLFFFQVVLKCIEHKCSSCKKLCTLCLLFSDIAENRLQVAKEMGADCTLLVKTGDANNLAQQIKQMMGDMPDITIECSGAEPSICLGILVSMEDCGLM